jgi:hypothetical protein
MGWRDLFKSKGKLSKNVEDYSGKQIDEKKPAARFGRLVKTQRSRNDLKEVSDAEIARSKAMMKKNNPEQYEKDGVDSMSKSDFVVYQGKKARGL